MEDSKKDSEPNTGIPSDLFQALLRLFAQDDPELAALVKKEIEEHQKAVKEGRWKPLR